MPSLGRDVLDGRKVSSCSQGPRKAEKIEKEQSSEVLKSQPSLDLENTSGESTEIPFQSEKNLEVIRRIGASFTLT